MQIKGKFKAKRAGGFTVIAGSREERADRRKPVRILLRYVQSTLSGERELILQIPAKCHGCHCRAVLSEAELLHYEFDCVPNVRSLDRHSIQQHAETDQMFLQLARVGGRPVHVAPA